jgi:NAD(P)-dependent dehydrogenase (short-subunit alcohol dehydrogenase family)
MQKVIVTGAASGLGLETTRSLMKGGYHVIMACRDLIKAATVRDQLIEQTGSSHISIRMLNLSSLTDIREFVAALDDDIYGLVCNAGVQNSKHLLFTKDNIEETFGVNYLGHFLLVNLLLAKNKNIKRIALVSSSLHDPATGGPRAPKLESVADMAHPLKKSIKRGDGLQRYTTSKLCMILFAYRLADLLKANGRNDVYVNAYNPGLMAGTDLARNATFLTHIMWYYILPVISKKWKGASTTKRSGTFLAKLIADISTTRAYFDIDKESKSFAESYDNIKAQRLWNESEDICGISTVDRWYQKTA